MTPKSATIDKSLKASVYEKLIAELRQTIPRNEKTVNLNGLSLRETRAKDDFPDADYASRIELCNQNAKAEAEIATAKARLQELRRLSVLARDTVETGALVEVWNGDDGKREIYFISKIYGRRASMLLGNRRIYFVTPPSPVWQALAGHAAGDTVVARAPNGCRSLEILAVV